MSQEFHDNFPLLTATRREIKCVPIHCRCLWGHNDQVLWKLIVHSAHDATARISEEVGQSQFCCFFTRAVVEESTGDRGCINNKSNNELHFIFILHVCSFILILFSVSYPQVKYANGQYQVQRMWTKIRIHDVCTCIYFIRCREFENSRSKTTNVNGWRINSI